MAGYRTLLHRFDDAPDIIFHVLQHVTTAHAELFATILWSIWKSRNLKLWQKPRCGRMKCNVDASFSTSMYQFGIRMCIRDEEGHLVLAKTMWFAPICSVDEGEALGMYHAVDKCFTAAKCGI